MQNENQIELEKQGEVMILDIRGDITAFSEPFLNEAYQTASSQGADKILVTAGASAPESVVGSTVDWLIERFGATVREETVRTEQVHFPLPKPLRKLAKAAESTSSQE